MGKAVPRDVDQGAQEDSARFEISQIEELPDEVE